jgi:acyl-coenzyme A synthetase/AMP-(fatty) acid ligase
VEEIKAFAKSLIGSVKAPKQIEVWLDLPRSKVGKVLKKDVRATLLQAAGQPRV